MNQTILRLQCYIESFHIAIILEQNKILKHIHNTFTVPCEKSKILFFFSSIMKNTVAPAAQSKFPVKLICCIAFESASSASCLVKSIAIIL